MIGIRFILVSTMPPSLFDILAISIVQSRNFTVIPLKTPEGGDIYYYTLIKGENNNNNNNSNNSLKITMSSPSSSKITIPSSLEKNNTQNNDPKLIELENIMEEVRLAQLEMENARKKVSLFLSIYKFCSFHQLIYYYYYYCY